MMIINQKELAIIDQAKKIMKKYIQVGKKISTIDHVKDYFIFHLGLYDYEAFCVLYLNSQNRIIALEELFRGTINESSVYPREIVKQVLYYQATAIILVHNHPSGDKEPSLLDILLTSKIKNALALIDVVVLDHLIVARDNVISIKENTKYNSMNLFN
ncbi:MAG: DNA repair protein RadC [Gilliamella sp.]|uniref:RadC family protein n=1 Tax=unclassified Gilliamella TaxID=2685620 RepID=UPI0009C12A6A|nr:MULTISPECIES: DNA repair protein RadC [Gilliamella]MCO6537769.1 DNA repair protein RadC [Gilliamella sp.]MCO6540351.1 DNA repair protein RadC [Gilliamella sp.]MCO6550666.1 DNA repair protein RadC [Gilliamella sp.]NUE96974.1 DNA repair protein RadC [Gilliamella sp. ESL0232]